MSIWSDLLSLHGYLTRAHEPHNEDAETAAARRDREADRLRELIGSRSPSTERPEPAGPLLGVRGLS
jgi:hypothetical protein